MGLEVALDILEVYTTERKRLEAIGRLRLDVWREETRVEESLFPEGKWIEPLDWVARHWIAVDENGLVGAARLTLHQTLEDNPDGYLWIRAGLTVPLPAAHFCKLVVLKRARGQGVGQKFNQLRQEAARAMGAKSILVTASESNTRLLTAIGFTDTGVRETFPNRPGFPFRALQYLFEVKPWKPDSVSSPSASPT